MKQIRTNDLIEFRSSTLVLLGMVLVVTINSAAAKEHKPRGSSAGSQVVAHISFSDLSAVDMAMQRKMNDKYYLYVEHAKDQGISIIDISKPTQPKVIGAIPWPDPGLSARMSLTGTVAIVSESKVLSMHSITSTDDLVLWDMSNPATPRVVQKFPKVVKWLQDERNFIYVLNGDGLWVISEPVDRQPEQTEPTLPYGD